MVICSMKCTLAYMPHAWLGGGAFPSQSGMGFVCSMEACALLASTYPRAPMFYMGQMGFVMNITDGSSVHGGSSWLRAGTSWFVLVRAGSSWCLEAPWDLHEPTRTNANQREPTRTNTNQREPTRTNEPSLSLRHLDFMMTTISGHLVELVCRTFVRVRSQWFTLVRLGSHWFLEAPWDFHEPIRTNANQREPTRTNANQREPILVRSRWFVLVRVRSC